MELEASMIDESELINLIVSDMLSMSDKVDDILREIQLLHGCSSTLELYAHFRLIRAFRVQIDYQSKYISTLSTILQKGGNDNDKGKEEPN